MRSDAVCVWLVCRDFMNHDNSRNHRWKTTLTYFDQSHSNKKLVSSHQMGARISLTDSERKAAVPGASRPAAGT